MSEVVDVSNIVNSAMSVFTNDEVKINTKITGETDTDMTVYRDAEWTIIDDFAFTSDPDNEEIKNLMTTISSGIFGMPYQWSELVDPVVKGTDFGQKYIDKVVSVMPVMFISPGEPAFMSSYTDDEKAGVLASYGSDMDIDAIATSSDAPFYTFNSNFEEYVNYVNIMVRALASFMGIANEKYTSGGDQLYNFNLHKVLNSDFKGFFNADTSVAFFLDSDASVSESFSNSTTESQLSQKINSLSDTGREIQFIAGSVTGSSIYEELSQSVSETAGNMLTNVTDGLGFGQSFANKVSAALTTVVTGGSMVFPEIWSGSEYSRNYNIAMKFRSPDPDPLSIMLSCYIPTCAVTALAMPRQIGINANGFSSPFLIRAVYKSIFNCEMGIVSSLDITKGGEDKWNYQGMPTAIDINMSIKDMYSTMFMSKGSANITSKYKPRKISDYAGLMNNMAELDYIALMAGIDMNKDWVMRNVKLKALLQIAAVNNIPTSAWNKFKNGANKSVTNFLTNVLGSDGRWNT